MKVHLVRHAKAERRAGWDCPDSLRPLAPRGVRQSRALARALAGAGIKRIVSSPHLRCTQTVEPLAAATGLPIEQDQRLAEGEAPVKALALLEEMGREPAVICSHGDLLPGLLTELEDRGADLVFEGRFRCQKASTWFVEGKNGKANRASYRPGEGGEREEEDEPERIAVLDLGSTSFRLVIFEATRAGRLTRLASNRIMLRLGAAIAVDGCIPESTCVKAVTTAHRLGEVAQTAGASRILPVATAALREADNGMALCTRIGQAMGTPVRVLSGEEEARLLFAAFRRRVLLPPRPALGIDLGGGSLELVAGDAADIHWEATLPVGVTRLHRELVTRDPMRRGDVRRVRERLIEELAPHREAIARIAPQTCFAAGGTARAFARIAVARSGPGRERSSAAVEIPVEDLNDLTRELVRADHEERLAMPSLRKGRADLMPTGGILLTALAESLGIESYTVCDWGLREGVVLEALGAT